MAAGLGFKTFTTGEVLTAGDVNGYLMQGINVFASSAARASAITSPQEGQYSFLKDTNALEYYDGAAWVGAPVGDITAVTAGTGISGGGSSGAVTITNSMATEITAKGDLIAGTGSATFDNLPVGTNGQTLVADSSTATGLKWATPAGGGGKVLQVVQGTYSTGVTVASTTYADTGLSLSITPSSASSKILVFVNQSYYNIRNTTNSSGLAIKLLRNSTTIFTPAPTGYETDFITVGGTITQVLHIGVAPLTYLDSPSTTSSVTYKTQGRIGNTADSGSVIFQNDAYSTITLMEIGA